MRLPGATTPARIYAANCSRKVTMQRSSRRCSMRCAAKNYSMIGAYTENFVAYHAARGQGPLRVRADLRRHGLEGTAG